MTFVRWSDKPNPRCPFCHGTGTIDGGYTCNCKMDGYYVPLKYLCDNKPKEPNGPPPDAKAPNAS